MNFQSREMDGLGRSYSAVTSSENTPLVSSSVFTNYHLGSRTRRLLPCRFPACVACSICGWGVCLDERIYSKLGVGGFGGVERCVVGGASVCIYIGLWACCFGADYLVPTI